MTPRDLGNINTTGNNCRTVGTHFHAQHGMVFLLTKLMVAIAQKFIL